MNTNFVNCEEKNVEKKEETNSNNKKMNIDTLSFQKQQDKNNNFQNEETKNLKKENKQNQSQMSIM